MVIKDVAEDADRLVLISPVEKTDLQQITRKRYFFDWRKIYGGACKIFKLNLVGQGDILGLISLLDFPEEFRIQIGLICASRENVGKSKRFSGIPGCLLAFAGELALRKYFADACISLIPKTELRPHYKRNYGMQDAGPQLYLDGIRLKNLVNKHIL